VSDILSKTIF